MNYNNSKNALIGGKNKFFLILLVPVIIFLIAGIFFIYYEHSHKEAGLKDPLSRRQTQNDNIKTVNEKNNEVAGWKIYTNKKFHLTTEIPENWEVLENSRSLIDLSFRNVKYNNAIECPGFNIDENPYKGDVAGVKNNDTFNIADINNQVIKIIFIFNNKNFYANCALYAQNESENKETLDICNRILSNFKIAQDKQVFIDTDQDNVSDEAEVNIHKTDPKNPDTDGDGYDDGTEIASGNDPLAPPKIIIVDPKGKEIEINESRYIILGNNALDAAKIRVIYKNNDAKLEDDYILAKFKQGETEWDYTADVRYQNLALGRNEYEVIAYDNKEKEIGRAKVAIKVAAYPTKKESVTVDWLPDLKPIEKNDQPRDLYGNLYLAGVVNSGAYKGRNLYLLAEPTMGGSFFMHFVEIDGKKRKVDDLNIELADLSKMPEKIQYNNSDFYLKSSRWPTRLKSELIIDQVLFIDENAGALFLACDASSGINNCSSYSCVMAELADHTVISYDFDFLFNNESGSLNIIFSNGNKNQDEYNPTKVKGCGALCSSWDFVTQEELKFDTRLKLAGMGSNDYKYYELKNTEDLELKDLYNKDHTLAWYENNEKLEKNKYTYSEFIAMHPILFWQDPIGRWIRLTNRKFDTMAEMCKPVIYLYPEKTSDINVQVKPNGGFTFADPAYNQGWYVRADPNGKIKEINSGKEYEYLFWEGIGLNLVEPEQGFIVKRRDLNKFFDKSLKQLNLNEKEMNDFKKYWIKRLNNSNYWFISFIDNKTFGELAPLAVSPMPDSIIRIFIYAKPLSAPIKVKEQKLIAQPRTGFTVVEWGGAVVE